MSVEQTHNYFDRENIPIEARKQQLFSSMEVISTSQEPSLATEAALYTSVIKEYSRNTEFQHVIDTFTETRTDMTVTHLRYMIRSSIQKQAIRQFGDTYPKGFDDPQLWACILDRICNDPETRDDVSHDLLKRHLQTNIPDRYKSVVLAVNWARSNARMPERITILDFGCSRNLGLKNIAAIEMNREFDGRIFHNFQSTDVVVPKDSEDISSSKVLEIDPTLSRAATLAHAQPTGLRVGIGFDIEDMHNPSNMEWALANLTPNEHSTRVASSIEFFENRFEKYFRLPDVIVSFQQEDILLGRHLNEFDFNETDPSFNESRVADVTLMFTVLNQMSEEERTKAISRAARYTKPDGLVLIQDFARVNEDNPQEIEFLDQNWNSQFSYRTIMLDMRNRTRFFEIMRWSTGRANTLYIPRDHETQAYPTLETAQAVESVDLHTFLGKYALGTT